jgi:hypothetical protein
MIANRIRECADDITGIAQRNGTPDEKTAAVNARIDRFFDDLADHLKGSPGQDGKKEIDALRYTLTNAAAKFATDRTAASDAICEFLEQAIEYVEQKSRP